MSSDSRQGKYQPSKYQPGEYQPAVDPWRVDLLPVVSLVLWLACLTIGLTGHYVRLTPPAAPPPAVAPTQATLVHVTLTHSPVPAVSPTPLPSADAAPPAVENPAIPDAPPLPQVVAISPAIAFAVPVDGPARIAPKALLPAPPAMSAAAPRPTGPVYKQIAYGSGEGAQPAPDYPTEAALAGQEGSVVVRYRVAEDGSITSAQVVKPCRWPLLNQAAERSIRETWSYPSGPVRYFEIKITYRSKSQ